MSAEVNTRTKPTSLGLRLAAYLCSVLALINPVAPAVANILSNDVIERDFTANPVYLPSSNTNYQYTAPQFLEWPAQGLTSLEAVYKHVLSEKSEAISEPTYVPIGVGDITTIIPLYKKYDYIGTAAVQARYVRTQMLALLNRNLIDFGNEDAQLLGLYSNAIDYMLSDGGPKYGQSLNLNQDASGLDEDMIWPELRTINGQQVIVPVLYLTADTVALFKVDDSEERIGNASFKKLEIRNSDIKAERDALINVAEDVRLYNGSLTSDDGNLTITAGGHFDNISSVVQANNGDLVIGAKNINNRTIVYRYDLGNEQGTRYGEISELASGGDLVLRSHGDIVFQGADATAGGALTLAADGNIFLGNQELFNGTSSRYTTRSQVDYLQSHLTAEEAIELIASGQILIDSAEITSNSGHIKLLGAMGVTVQSALASTHSVYQKGSTREEAYKTVAMRALLDAGEHITIHAEFGDITLNAAELSTTSGTSVTASGGAINLLVTKETDHYSYSSVKESLFTIKTINRGHDIETAVPTTIVGGFEANPLFGLNVEYEGDPSYTFDEQIDELSKMPGLEYLADIRSDTSLDINWTEIETKYKEWNETNTSLSPAAMAIIVIVVAVVTAGAGAAIAGAVANSAAVTGAVGTTAASALGSAAAAGFTSMVTAATLASTNAALNGEDPFRAAFETQYDDEALRSAAIAAVTAGAISAVDAQFFDVADASTNSAFVTVNADGQNVLSLAGQATQIATQAAVSSGISALARGGDFTGFEDLFVSSLLSNVSSRFGQNIASEIGSASLNDLSRYLAHAALGCGLGAIEAELGGATSTDSGCASGAGGGVIGELTASIYADIGWDQNDATFENWRNTGVGISQITAAFVVALADGDASIAGMTGRNAAQYNALSLKEKVKYGVKGAQCLFARDTTSCFSDLALESALVSIQNDQAFAQGLWSGVQAEADALANIDEDLKALFKVIVAGDFKTIAAGLRDAVADMPKQLIDQADAFVALSLTAEGPDEYREIGETLAPLLIEAAVTLVSAGSGTIAKKTFEALADTAASVRRTSGTIVKPNLSQGEADDFYQSVKSSAVVYENIFRGTVTKADFDRALSIRSSLAESSLPNNLRKKFGGGRGNIGFADFDIAGEKGSLTAFSGRDDLPGFAPFVEPENRILTSIEVGAFNRAVDAEAKILEQVLKTTYPTDTGTIRLFTELPVCDSCDLVIKQFSEKRPNIDVQIIEGVEK